MVIVKIEKEEEEIQDNGTIEILSQKEKGGFEQYLAAMDKV